MQTGCLKYYIIINVICNMCNDVKYKLLSFFMLFILYPMICHISYAVEYRYLHIINRSADTVRAYLSFVYLHKLDARLFGSRIPTLPQNKRHKCYYNMFDVCCVYQFISKCCFVKCSFRRKLIFQ
jgi:hypothetical protein